MPGLFVSGSGTDIGKTYVTLELIRYLRARKITVRAIKPVVTGYTVETSATSDCALLLDALGEPLTSETLDAVSPWRYRAALGPIAAAALEGTVLDYDAIAAFAERTVLDRASDFTLIEGLGGVMVPLDGEHTLLDVMARVALPVVLVTGTYLGALSHTLTALAALATRRLRTVCVVNESGDSSVTLDQTVDALRPLLARDGVPLVTLRRHATTRERTACCEAIVGASPIDVTTKADGKLSNDANGINY